MSKKDRMNEEEQRQKKQELLSGLGQYRLPLFTEIPSVGLFLEQVSKYINEFLAPLGLAELTGSMISNYVKMDLIDNPVRKQYGREQIADLMFAAVAKNVLSLEDITRFLTLRRESLSAEEAYNFFREEFPAALKAVAEGSYAMKPSDVSGCRELCCRICAAAAHGIHLNLLIGTAGPENDAQKVCGPD